MYREIQWCIDMSITVEQMSLESVFERSQWLQIPDVWWQLVPCCWSGQCSTITGSASTYVFSNSFFMFYIYSCLYNYNLLCIKCFADYSIAWVLHSGPHLSSWFLQYTVVFVNQWHVSDVSLYVQGVWQWYSSQGDCYQHLLLPLPQRLCICLGLSLHLWSELIKKLWMNFHEIFWCTPWDKKSVILWKWSRSRIFSSPASNVWNILLTKSNSNIPSSLLYYYLVDFSNIMLSTSILCTSLTSKNKT